MGRGYKYEISPSARGGGDRNSRLWNLLSNNSDACRVPLYKSATDLYCSCCCLTWSSPGLTSSFQITCAMLFGDYHDYRVINFFCFVTDGLMVDEFLLVADDYRHQIYQTDKNGDNVVALRFPHWDRPIGKDS